MTPPIISPEMCSSFLRGAQVEHRAGQKGDVDADRHERINGVAEVQMPACEGNADGDGNA
jgi:hypothetical protein